MTIYESVMANGRSVVELVAFGGMSVSVIILAKAFVNTLAALF